MKYIFKESPSRFHLQRTKEKQNIWLVSRKDVNVSGYQYETELETKDKGTVGRKLERQIGVDPAEVPSYGSLHSFPVSY